MECPQCGKDVEAGWSFCRWCGHELAEPIAASPVSTADAPTDEPTRPDVVILHDEPATAELSGAVQVSTTEAVPTEDLRILDEPTPAVSTSSDVTAPLQQVTTFMQAPPPQNRRRPVVAIIAGVVAVLALVAAVLTFVSRAGISDTLASTRTELSSTKEDLASTRSDLEATKKALADSQSNAQSLDQQVDSLSVAKADVESDLQAVRDKNASLQKKVDACQEMLEVSAQVGRTGSASDAQYAKFTSDVLKCYGKFPDWLGF
jgi:zinc-ribbon domain